MPRRPLRAEDLAPARLGQLDEERLRDVARVVGDVGDDDLLEAVASAEERRADVVIYRRTNVPFVEALRIIEGALPSVALHEALVRVERREQVDFGVDVAVLGLLLVGLALDLILREELRRVAEEGSEVRVLLF